MPAVLEAFRTGAGVPFEAYGTDVRRCLERVNRLMFVNDLAASWFPTMPDLVAPRRRPAGGGGRRRLYRLVEHLHRASATRR